jgi:hypothetical protein
MSSRGKLALAASFALAAAGAGVWAWFLSRRGLGDASEWSGVLQGFAALLTVPAVVIAVLGLRTPERDKRPGGEGNGQSVSFGDINATGDSQINIQQANVNISRINDRDS